MDEYSGCSVPQYTAYPSDRQLMLDCLNGERMNLKMMVLNVHLVGRSGQPCLGLHECQNLG